MAKRSREHRQDIPGYNETRPTREERKQQHRATRHAANQMLSSYEDVDEIVLPREKRSGKPEPVASDIAGTEPPRRRYKVWKTKFWKRRDGYQDEKAAIDAEWPVITPDQLPEQ